MNHCFDKLIVRYSLCGFAQLCFVHKIMMLSKMGAIIKERKIITLRTGLFSVRFFSCEWGASFCVLPTTLAHLMTAIQFLFIILLLLIFDYMVFIPCWRAVLLHRPYVSHFMKIRFFFIFNFVADMLCCCKTFFDKKTHIHKVTIQNEITERERINHAK